MPCLFFRNVPVGQPFYPDSVERLYEHVSKAVGLDVNDVQVHIEDTRYTFFRPDGKVAPGEHGVHVFVDWSTGRDQSVKDSIASAINEFLRENGLWRRNDITFRDSPPGSFYIEGRPES